AATMRSRRHRAEGTAVDSRQALDGQLDHHAGADTLDGGDADFAAVRFDDLPHDVEAESGAAAAADRLVRALLVLLPDLLQFRRLDAHAAVRDGDDDRLGDVAVAHDLRAHGDQSLLRRELQRVGDEIDHGLSELLHAAEDLRDVAAVRADQKYFVPRGHGLEA